MKKNPWEIPQYNMPVTKMPNLKLPKMQMPDVNLTPWIGKEPEGKGRTQIPPKLRKQVWEKQFGNRKSGKCPVCEERTIYCDAFHCAHRVSVKNNGTDTLRNLVPACQRCNLQMGIQNLRDYKKVNYPKTTTKTKKK
jgi:5-methylcytosine-specific restriction endonuclease McrA